MVLVDTSVWVEHFRIGNIKLQALLNEGQVSCHTFIIGELACGNITNRTQILSLLNELPMAVSVEHEEVMYFIDKHNLMGKGLGYIDINLIASTILTNVPLWTLDKRLNEATEKLGIAYLA